MSRLMTLLFNAGAAGNAWLTRRPWARWLEVRILTPLYVRATYRIRGARRVEPNAAALGAEWERLLGGREVAGITAVDGDTAYGEIRALCPLRGTGDVDACYRMMAYDRGLLARSGGQLVVLESQAEAGRTTCRVAIRRLEDPAQDLVPAHVRLGIGRASVPPS